MDLEQAQAFPYARLVYLLVSHNLVIPNRLAKWIPGGDWLQEIAVNPASMNGGDSEQVLELYQQGEQLGQGNREEAAKLLGEYLDLLLGNNDIPWDERLTLYTLVKKMEGSGNHLEYEEYDLGSPGKLRSCLSGTPGLSPWTG